MEGMFEKNYFSLGNEIIGLHITAVTDPALSQYFSQQVEVFGTLIVGTSDVQEDKVLHAANVMAQYIDNDGDGVADDAAVEEALRTNKALLVMFPTSDELEAAMEQAGMGGGEEEEIGATGEDVCENHGFHLLECNRIDCCEYRDLKCWSAVGSDPCDSRRRLSENLDIMNGYWIQDLLGDETNEPNRFDATLEEVLHLIQTAGYAFAHTDLAPDGDSTLMTLVDAARGGDFHDPPATYPSGSWFHYDDETCDRACNAVEYFYWGLTSLLGA